MNLTVNIPSSKGNPKFLGAAVLAALFACASLPKSEFIPFRLMCSISAKSFPGILDIPLYAPKQVVLLERMGLEGGERLVDRLGNYEFWVTTGETVFGRGRIEVLSYFGEIRDMRSQTKVRARSGILSRKPDDPKMVKNVFVAVQRPRPPGQTETPSVSMHCYHETSVPEERLILRHE